MRKIWLFLALFATGSMAETIAQWPEKETGGIYHFFPGPEGMVKPCTGHVKGKAGVLLYGGMGQRSLLLAKGLGSCCDVTNRFTVEGWFKKEKDPGEKFWALAGARDDANGWTLSLMRTDAKHVRFCLFVSDVNAGGKLQFESFFPNANLFGDTAWHHVALTYDPYISRGAWSLFLDGIWQGTLVNSIRPNRSHGYRDFLLGGRLSFSNSFEGILSDWRVCDAVLSYNDFLCAVPPQPRETAPLPFDPRSVSAPASASLPDWTKSPDFPSYPGPTPTWTATYTTPFSRAYAFCTTGTNDCAFTYSDDSGKTWNSSWRKFPAPLPSRVRGVGKPFLYGEEAVLLFTNATAFSKNIQTERNAGRVTFRVEQGKNTRAFFDPSLSHLSSNRVIRLSGENPVFATPGLLSGAGDIRWGEPELVLFDAVRPDRKIVLSEVREQEGKLWGIGANAYSLPPLFRSFGNVKTTEQFSSAEKGSVDVPAGFGDFKEGGLSIALEANFEDIADGQFLFNTMNGREGVRVMKTSIFPEPILRMDLLDGSTNAVYLTPKGALSGKTTHRIVLVADFSARILYAAVDGRFLSAWSRMPLLRRVDGMSSSRTAEGMTRIGLYPRALSVPEAASLSARLPRKGK